MSYKISDARNDLNNIADDENLFNRMIKVNYAGQGFDPLPRR